MTLKSEVQQVDRQDDFIPDEIPLDSDNKGVPTGNTECTANQLSKFKKYYINVSPQHGNKATQIKLCSCARPHMRAFHYAWWCYHVAFLMWFSISPLLTEVRDSLGLSHEQIWTSSIAAVSGTVILRTALGPFVDKYGPRIPMAIVLIFASIPTGLIGLVQSATGLTVVRFFIGMGGSTFVMVQFWMSIMFTKEVVGTANATTAGWGNLGGGVTQILMGSICFPLFRYLYGGDRNKAWRTACIVPAIMGLLTGIGVLKLTDDTPNGNFAKLKKQGVMGNVSMSQSFILGAVNLNTWFLFVQYACCFGVEITMNNAAALYFKDTFDMTTESAALVAAVFGWMNLFARGVGGYISDVFNARMGMKGRLLWQSICLAIEGAMVLIFAQIKVLWVAIFVMVIFSTFVQACEGSSFGIVPYINPPVTGSISGIVGAGGNVGAIAFGFCFRQMSAKSAFMTMGSIILFSAALSVCVRIPAINELDVKGDDLELATTEVKPPTTNADTSFTTADEVSEPDANSPMKP